MGVKINSFGHFIPNTPVTNAELSKKLNVPEEWILERTGIAERKYHSGPTSDMAINAIKDCLYLYNDAVIENIDCLIIATMTPDFLCPSTASVIHNKMHFTHKTMAFDVSAACNGFMYGLHIARAMINSKTHRKVLLVGADKFSSIMGPDDKKTRLVFGDGAGAVLLSESDTGDDAIVAIRSGMNSDDYKDLMILAGGSFMPNTIDTVNAGSHYLKMYSKEIFKNGVALMKRSILSFMEENKLSFDDFDRIVTHQPNKRMVEALARELDQPISKFILKVEDVGNTSAACVPIAISNAIKTGQLKGNEKILVNAIGAGFSYSTALINLGVV